MNQKNGFTLIEVLFVLGILSILLLLSTPLNISSLEKQQEKQFLETFESDVLYIQALTASTQDSFFTIKFHTDSYEILQGLTKPREIRPYPPGWKIINKDLKEISFTTSGTVRKAGSLEMIAKDAIYRAVFQPGKGRFYIVKE